MRKWQRVVWIVLDSVGIGAMPDSASFGDDPGSDTLGNLARVRRLRLPTFQKLGLANLKSLIGIDPVAQPSAAYGRCALASPGKDTTTGHWEMVGIHLQKPFPLYPNGFPSEVVQAFEDAIGRKTLANRAASGTEIIAELGDEHVRTGSPIIYTSADSVFQIAAHEQVVPLPELYRFCELARELLDGPHKVGRVIARPFTGTSGAYRRTTDRHDYAVRPPEGMLLDRLAELGILVHSVGKISDIFLGRGIASSEKSASNREGMDQTLQAFQRMHEGVVFTNLVDFDSLFGHRNDVAGYAAALEEVDSWLPNLLRELIASDLLILTADHGCDPTTPGTDHSREYVPLLVIGGRATNLGTRTTLSDIGQTVAENFGCHIAEGQSFLDRLQ